MKTLALFVVVITGAMLIYAGQDLPPFGDPNTDMYQHRMTQRFIECSDTESGVPNIVTALLANYRGYDTLGETTVIFTAGMAVILLLRRRER
ncbi:MAG: hydrogen gas-evolving membrane-bound hydrogenase subunit E [Euryarchaeota archaeon]|nr:MAG: multicomponent Na+:H+ antiporter subunit B [ANME-2 cluster archaeon]MEA1865484.1 hydrogen gas-evolving membrane-bound hydrogenase subunit E [Euryarchaeota archaeon]